MTDGGAGRIRLPMAPAPPESGLGRRELDGARAEEAQIAGPALCVGDPRHQDQTRPRIGIQKSAEDEGTRRTPQARYAQADDSPCPGPGERAVRGPILE